MKNSFREYKGYKIVTYNDPSGHPHVRTTKHYQVWEGGLCHEGGKHIYKASSLDDAKWYIDQLPHKAIWDTDAAVNDVKDIKRRLQAAGFKGSEWSVRAGTVYSGPRKGEIDDAKISARYPLDSKQLVLRSQSLIDAGFDVTWATTMLDSGKRILSAVVNSVGRQGEISVVDADKPVGSRITKFKSYKDAMDFCCTNLKGFSEYIQSNSTKNTLSM